MSRKILGLALLALVFFALSGCATHHRANYRDGYAPGYVQVRVGKGYNHGVLAPGRSHGPYPRHHRHKRHRGR